MHCEDGVDSEVFGALPLLQRVVVMSTSFLVAALLSTAFCPFLHREWYTLPLLLILDLVRFNFSSLGRRRKRVGRPSGGHNQSSFSFLVKT
jgi:hypothetical protein